MMQTLLLLVNEWPIISWSVMIIYLIIALLVYCTVVVISLLCREAPLQKLVSSLYYSNSESVNSGANLAGLQESALPSAAQGNHPVVQAENMGHMTMAVLLFANSLCKTKTLQENMVIAESMNDGLDTFGEQSNHVGLGSLACFYLRAPWCLQGCLIHLSQICPNICTYGVTLPRV